MILSLGNIKKAFGAEDVLLSVSLMLEDGEKAAVVGVNGAGKTTLFRIITGELAPDEGEVALKKGAVMGYLAQSSEIEGDNTVYDELLTVFEGVMRLEASLRAAEADMAGKEGRELQGLLERYEKMTREFEDKRGYTYKSLTRGVAKGLGFTDAEMTLPVKNLSGGQKTRVALGKLLLAEPDLLLLDEPTNHLDIEAVAWLEDYLKKSFPGSVLIISHDRYFLDRIVTKVVELDRGESKTFPGNYTSYAFKKETDRDIQIKHFVNQQKEIKRQEEIIRRYRSYAQEWSIRKAKTREKMLSKVKRLELPNNDHKIRILLEPRTHSGNDVLHVEGLSMAFREPLFENVGFDIYRGEVVALIGPNGVGKTTLLKIILGRLRGRGLVRLGAGVHAGYYDQDQTLISDEKTVFDEIYDAFPQMKASEIRTALAAFMFCGDDVFKRIGALSGGEKGRVSLAKLMLGHANFLLIDEPTNHLDIFSREVLEEALRGYTGTILYVSHDRYFIEATADRVIELSPAGAVSYDGGYEYYMEKKAERGEALEAAPTEDSRSKTDYKRRKDETAEERKRLSRLKRLEEDIAGAEERLRELDKALETDEVATDAEKAQAAFTERAALDERLHGMYEEWHTLSD